MDEHFNKLTPAQSERIAMLAEEAAEVVQICGKILRHGLGAHHPDDPNTNNSELLVRELADLTAVKHMLFTAGDIGPTTFSMIDASYVKKHRYAHHQVPAERTTP